MRSFILILLILCGLGYFLWSSISKQSLTVAPLPTPSSTPTLDKEPSTITTEQATEVFLSFVEQCKETLREFEQVNEASLIKAKASAATSQYAQQPTLKPLILTILNSVQQAQLALIAAKSQYNRTDSKPRTQLDTDETYKKTKELQLHNIERSWETKRDQLLALLSQQESALRSATQPIATTTLPNNDSLITTLTVAQSTAKHEKWLRDNSKNLTIEIIQVIDKGVLADNMKLQVVASSSARVGMGGGVGSYYGRSGKIIFVDGLKGMAEQQRKDIVAAPDGTYTYTDVSGASRTVEKWTFIKNQ